MIVEFENSVSSRMDGYQARLDADNNVYLLFDYGDGMYYPNFDLYDFNDVLFYENASGREIPMSLNNQMKLKSKDSIIVNGIKYYSKFSDVKTFQFEIDDKYLVNKYDGTNKEIVDLISSYPGTIINLPIGYKVNSSAFNNSNITKVIIPSGYNLDGLAFGSLRNSYYTNGTKNVVLNTVVNLTGQSIDWAPIVGEYSLTCEFETGTCGDVTITNVE